MKVYLVLSCNWQDHEGGGASVDSVHASNELAETRVRAILKEAGLNHDGPNSIGEWGYRDYGGASYWHEIEEHEVNDHVQ